MVKLTREMVVANLYVMKIHLLIVKLLIVKEFSSLTVKIFQQVMIMQEENSYFSEAGSQQLHLVLIFNW